LRLAVLAGRDDRRRLGWIRLDPDPLRQLRAVYCQDHAIDTRLDLLPAAERERLANDRLLLAKRQGSPRLNSGCRWPSGRRSDACRRSAAASGWTAATLVEVPDGPMQAQLRICRQLAD